MEIENFQLWLNCESVEKLEVIIIIFICVCVCGFSQKNQIVHHFTLSNSFSNSSFSLSFSLSLSIFVIGLDYDNNKKRKKWKNIKFSRMKNYSTWSEWSEILYLEKNEKVKVNVKVSWWDSIHSTLTTSIIYLATKH